MTNQFDPNVYSTTCCSDVIFSSTRGQFTPCKCGSTFVDDAGYYIRHSGHLVFVGKLSTLVEDVGELRYVQETEHGILFHKVSILGKLYYSVGVAYRPYNYRLDNSVKIGEL